MAIKVLLLFVLDNGLYLNPQTLMMDTQPSKRLNAFKNVKNSTFKGDKFIFNCKAHKVNMFENLEGFHSEYSQYIVNGSDLSSTESESGSGNASGVSQGSEYG